MAKIKVTRKKEAPEGFQKLKPTLDNFQEKHKAIQASVLTRTSKKSEGLWEIFRITHQKSRYVYELYYKKKAISKDLYDYLLKNKYADGNLIAKWKKQGYENLCCLKCIQAVENNNGGTCICRVPRETLEKQGKINFTECINCGCHGCSSTD